MRPMSFFFAFLFLFFFFQKVSAQEVETFTTVSSSGQQNEIIEKGEELHFEPVSYFAQVKQILESGVKTVDDQEYIFQKLQLEILNKNEKGKTIELTTDYKFLQQAKEYTVGQKLMVTKNRAYQSQEDFYLITDNYRVNTLLFLAIIFLLVVFLVARVWGLRSLLAMFFSFFIIFRFLLPQIMLGRDPVLISIFTAILILPIVFIVSHGLNAKTIIALFSTFFGLVLSIFMAKIFVEMAALTGLSSEEAGFLQVEKGGLVNVQALLLAGIVVGTFGILDDVAVSQVSVVKQLHEAKPDAEFNELYRKAMVVGQDHISSMINTLLLVYAGASLPLLLLFYDSERSFLEVINQEIVAEEIIKILVGSITLVLIAPISTLAAAFYYGNFSRSKVSVKRNS